MATRSRLCISDVSMDTLTCRTMPGSPDLECNLPFFHVTAPRVTPLRGTKCRDNVFSQGIFNVDPCQVPCLAQKSNLIWISFFISLASRATHREISQNGKTNAPNVKLLSNIFRFYYRVAFGAFPGAQDDYMRECFVCFFVPPFQFAFPILSHFVFSLKWQSCERSTERGQKQRANLVSCFSRMRFPMIDSATRCCSVNWKRQRLFTPELFFLDWISQNFKRLRSIFS